MLDFTRILETFIGSLFAFLLAVWLQRWLMKQQQAFQLRLTQRQEEFQQRMEQDRTARQAQDATAVAVAKVFSTPKIE